jgi:hypothetical protein
MLEKFIVTLTSPSTDLPHYPKLILAFFVEHFPYMYDTARTIIGFLMGLSIPLSLLLCIGIAVSIHGLKTVRKREELIYNKKIETAYDEVHEGDPELAMKWDKILARVESKNESDWRQAIIEADIILGDLLVKMGYKGMTIGEQLDRVAKGDFKTLAQANEAHHVRNRIAHDGSDYPLSQYEARRVINLYREVFEEFFYI